MGTGTTHQPLQPSGQDLRIAYSSTTQHWIHAEETRWSLLYNYFMASSILLLAWAGVFTTRPSWDRKIVLLILSGSGLVVSVIWIFLVYRANGFVHAYAQLGERLERSITGTPGDGAANDYPFTCAQAHRHTFNRFVNAVNSRHSILLVPSLFAALYAALVFVAYRSPTQS